MQIWEIIVPYRNWQPNSLNQLLHNIDVVIWDDGVRLELDLRRHRPLTSTSSLTSEPFSTKGIQDYSQNTMHRFRGLGRLRCELEGQPPQLDAISKAAKAWGSKSLSEFLSSRLSHRSIRTPGSTQHLWHIKDKENLGGLTSLLSFL